MMVNQDLLSVRMPDVDSYCYLPHGMRTLRLGKVVIGLHPVNDQDQI